MKNIDSIIQILQNRGHIKLGFQSTHFYEFKESNNNSVYRIDSTVIKIHEGPEAKLCFEGEILKELEYLSICPKFHFFEEIEIDGIRYEILGIEYLNGEGLQHYWEKYSPHKKIDTISQIISGIKAIHSIEKDYFFDIQVSPKRYPDYFSLLTEKFEKLSEIAQYNPFLNGDDLLLIKNTFYNLSDVFKSEKPVLVHHDIWYKNILGNSEGFLAIIDFETSIFAPKQLELFRLLHHKFSAKQYLDSGSQDYTEMDFLELLIEQIQAQYPDLFNVFQEKQFLAYNLVYYISLLSKYKNNWYDHENTIAFKETFIIPFMSEGFHSQEALM